jgi:hypothetical protein
VPYSTLSLRLLQLRWRRWLPAVPVFTGWGSHTQNRAGPHLHAQFSGDVAARLVEGGHCCTKQFQQLQQKPWEENLTTLHELFTGTDNHLSFPGIFHAQGKERGVLGLRSPRRRQAQRQPSRLQQSMNGSAYVLHHLFTGGSMPLRASLPLQGT